MMETSKIKLSEDDFVLVGMNCNYYVIPRLAYAEDNLEDLKQRILKIIRNCLWDCSILFL